MLRIATKRRLAVRLALGISVGFGAGAAPAAAQQRAAEQLQGAYENLASADLRQLRRGAAPLASVPLDTLHPQRAVEQAAGAQQVVRLSWSRSGPEAQPYGGILAWRGGDGRWMVSRAYVGVPERGARNQIPWGHEQGVTAEGLPPSVGSMTEGALTAEQSRDLELLLASRCLASEPHVRPMEIPMRRGPAARCSWHPTSYEMEVVERGQRRRYVRHCTNYGDVQVTWPTDLLVDFLSQVQIAQSAPSDAARPLQGVVPSGFLHKWGPSRDERCATAFTSFEIRPDELIVPLLFKEAHTFEVLGERTLRVLVRNRVTFTGLNGEPDRVEEVEEPAWLLLSPDGKQLAASFDAGHFGTVIYDRCEALQSRAKDGGRGSER